MDGYETAAMIRQRKKTKDLPILFLTAYRTADMDSVKPTSRVELQGKEDLETFEEMVRAVSSR